MIIGFGVADYSHRYRLQPIPLDNRSYYEYIADVSVQLKSRVLLI